MTDCTASPWAAIVEPMDFPELTNFVNFAELKNFAELAELTEKDWTPGKSLNSQKRLNSQKKRVPAPQPTPIYKLSMTPMVWNISMGQLGPAAWPCSLPAPALLLISPTWETEKNPWFLINNWKLQCIINIILILNAKQSSYWEES